MKTKVLEIRDDCAHNVVEGHDGTKIKTCARCGEATPLTAEFWHRCSRTPCGFQAPCKICCRQISQEHYRRTSTRPTRQPRMSADEKRKRQREAKRIARGANLEKFQRRELGQRLRRLYGITLERYDEMFAAQGRSCAICRKSEWKPRFWHVDHCHNTRRVRGILCSGCNIMLAQAREAPATLRAAAHYLEALA